MKTNIIKTYSELITLPSFIERYRYLKIGGRVGSDTFGHERYLNQMLYSSSEWKRFRRGIILRDNGCDLGDPDRPIPSGVSIYVHHINPITPDDVINRNPIIFDPENAISVTHITHNAIHYGDESLLITDPIVREPNDTCPWRI